MTVRHHWDGKIILSKHQHRGLRDHQCSDCGGKVVAVCCNEDCDGSSCDGCDDWRYECEECGEPQ